MDTNLQSQCASVRCGGCSALDGAVLQALAFLSFAGVCWREVWVFVSLRRCSRSPACNSPVLQNGRWGVLY